jgi:hypothetical protein
VRGEPGGQEGLGAAAVDALDAELARERGAGRDRRRVGDGVAPRVVVQRRRDHVRRRSGGGSVRARRHQRGDRAFTGGRLERERRGARATVVRDRKAEAPALRALHRVERLPGDHRRWPRVSAQRVLEQRSDRHRAVLRGPAADHRDRISHPLRVPDRGRHLGDAVRRRVEQRAHERRLRGHHLLGDPRRSVAQLGGLVLGLSHR